MPFGSDKQRKAAFAKKRIGTPGPNTRRVGLFRSHGPSGTGLGEHEADVVNGLVGFMETYSPDDLDGLDAVSLDTFPEILDMLDLEDYVENLPPDLYIPKWNDRQRRAILALVEAKLRERGNIVVQRRADLLPALAQAGKLRAEHLGAFKSRIEGRVDLAEARKLSERGRSIYTVQDDGHAVSGIRPVGARYFVALRGET